MNLDTIEKLDRRAKRFNTTNPMPADEVSWSQFSLVIFILLKFFFLLGCLSVYSVLFIFLLWVKQYGALIRFILKTPYAPFIKFFLYNFFRIFKFIQKVFPSSRLWHFFIKTWISFIFPNSVTNKDFKGKNYNYKSYFTQNMAPCI